MTTEQLDALAHAADDEARFPISAGRAAIAETAGGGAGSPLWLELVSGLVTAAVAVAVISLPSYPDELARSAGLFCAVAATTVLTRLFQAYYRRKRHGWQNATG